MTIAHARRFTVVALASTIGAALLTMGPPALAVGACPAVPPPAVSTDVGGSICQVQFTSSTTWTVPAGVTSVDVVVVGGGGGGNGAAAGRAGGGGGGGEDDTATVAVVPGTSVVVTVGSGGSGGSSSSPAGAAGGSSSFGAVTASGGAAGSGGPSNGNRSGGLAGNAGGATTDDSVGGGGGGAGGNGNAASPPNGGTGGNGTTAAFGLFTGVTTKYGGGGGGGSASGTAGSGRDGGGGGGSTAFPFGEPGASGGGGGGAGPLATSAPFAGGIGGQGGMGVVIVRFLAPPVPPAAPTSLVATPQDGAASIAFTPGASGTSPISNYQYTLDDSTWIALVPDDTTSPVTIPTLTNGTTYSVKLRAVSLAGNGTASSAVSVTAGVVPAAPTGLEASAGNATATIAFTAGAEGTLPINNYSYSLNGGATWTALSPAVTTSPVTLTGLTNGTTYSVQLRAVSAVGPGAASTAVSVTPVAPTPQPDSFPPSAPVSVTGVAGDGFAVLSWAAPASPGSFPVTNYQAVVSPGEQTCLVSAPALTCTISGLSNGTPYTATVRALNGAGWGPYSAASATFTPQPPVTPSITITGTRGDVRGKPGVVVTGTTTGFDMGAILRPWIRFPGQTSYTQGTASILVDVQGGFTWERRTGKTIYISIRSEDGTVESNRLVVRTT